jgi:hypothetical protein
MQLHEFQYLPPVTLSASQTVYRVQRIKARPGAVTTGPLKTAPIGDMSGRFALTGAATGYFAESPETAVYESLVRREAVWLSISNAASAERFHVMHSVAAHRRASAPAAALSPSSNPFIRCLPQTEEHSP